MRLKNVTEVDGLMAVVSECSGSVWLEAPDGSKFNLKSNLNKYVAIASLIVEEGDKLELYCANTDDEARFITYFTKNPDALKDTV